jgi:hypothetical protein
MRCLLAVSVLLFAAAVPFGCGTPEEGYSGVAPDERVGALSEDEMRELCAWVIGRQGGEGAVHECGNGVTVTLDTIDECVAEQDDYASCSLTVAQMEQCVIDAGSNPCRAPSTPSCQPLGQCRQGS